jgi:hypothetical protein
MDQALYVCQGAKLISKKSAHDVLNRGCESHPTMESP